MSDKEKARSYQASKQMLTFVSMGWTLLFLIGMIVTPLSIQLQEWAQGFDVPKMVQLSLFFLGLSLLKLPIDLALSWYSGHFLEHKYELSNQNFSSWAGTFLKKILLSFVFSLFLLMFLYVLIWKYSESWWVLAWGGFIFVSVIMGKLFPIFIVPLFYKYSDVESSLKNRIVKLVEKYDMPLQNVYSINLSKTTKKANAAFMGFGKTKRVVLSDTLIDQFTEDEIEVVVAHELGHYQHKDLIRMLSLSTVISFITFWGISRLIDPLSSQYGLGGVQALASMPLVFLVLYLISIVFMPLQNGFSRMMERGADLFALEVLKSKETFISCMNKLGTLNLADPAPHPLYEWFFYDHPSIKKRVQMAEGLSI